MISKGEQAESVSFIAESSGHCLTIGKLHLQAGLNVDGVKFAVCRGLHSCPLTSLAYAFFSIYGPDHHADRLHWVETSAIVGPEDTILVFATVDTSVVPDTVEIGLATSVVPPASFMEMGTITCEWETEELVIILVILLSEVIGTALENITIILKKL